MKISDAKLILHELDRLNLEIRDGINLLDDAGVISNHILGLGDIADEDGAKCVEFLQKYPAK